MNVRNLFISTVLILTLSPILANAQAERKFIRQGNKIYNNVFADSTTVDSVKLQEAEAKYRQAIEKDPNNWDANYNLANTLTRQNRIDEAARQYQALSSRSDIDKKKRAAAFHNLGNCMLQGNNLQGAIEAYKDALRNNPNDLETKYNLAWAQDKMRQQQNEQQQNQDQNKQDENQEQQNKDNQQQDQQQNQEQQEQQNQDQQQQQDNQQQQEQKPEPQPQDQTEQQMSKEDAMRILEALENDEKDVQDKVQKQKAQPQRRRTQKDW